MTHRIIFLFISLLTLSLSVNAQKKCKFKYDKYDDFTETRMIMTEYQDLGSQTEFLGANYKIQVAAKAEISRTDTIYYLVLFINHDGISEGDNPYKILKGNKFISIFDDGTKETLTSRKDEIGKLNNKTSLTSMYADRCFLYAYYQVPIDVYDQFLNHEILKCRVEMNFGLEWEKVSNLDIELIKSDTKNNRDNVIQQLNCIKSNLIK